MYKIKAVSKMLDMPTVTIRSWETRYNAITPERTDSGHRVYTEENVKDLKRLKKMIEIEGLSVSQAVKMLKEDKKKDSEDIRNSDISDWSFQMQIDELFDAVHEMDTNRCHFLLDLYFSQFHYKVVIFSIIVPLMYKVGDAWERGELHVVKEHMISNIVIQRLMKLFDLFEVSPRLPKVMAICPEGEQHQIGLMLFTLFLRENHYQVQYIGADTPLKGMGKLVKEQDIDIVALSTSRTDNANVIDHYIDAIQEENPQMKFIVGGLGVKKTSKTNSRWNVAATDSNWTEILLKMG